MSIFNRHIPAGFVKAFIYGANDGIITTFAVVTGVSGANLESRIILILGIANMIADGISMGLGDYLGERSERRFQQSRNNLNHNPNRLGSTSLITFLAFVTAGSLPLLPYVMSLLFKVSLTNLLLVSSLSTLFALFSIGSLRTLFTKGSWWKNGLEMLLVGTLAASASFLIGRLVGTLISPAM